MAYIIAVANQKGGVGKTSVAATLADAFVRCDYKTLIIDTDPQCNATLSFKAKTENEYTLYDIFENNCKTKEAIQHTEIGDIIPGDLLLSGKENIYMNENDSYLMLKKAIEEIKEEYDIIVIDTPPNLGIYLINSLAVADGIIIPIAPQRYAIEGLKMLIDTINQTTLNLNSKLHILGVLLVAYDSRKNLDKRINRQLPDIGRINNFNVFKHPIRICQAVREAQDEQVSLFEFAPDCTAAKDYVSLVKEIQLLMADAEAGELMDDAETEELMNDVQAGENMTAEEVKETQLFMEEQNG